MPLLLMVLAWVFAAMSEQIGFTQFVIDTVAANVGVALLGNLRQSPTVCGDKLGQDTPGAGETDALRCRPKGALFCRGAVGDTS